MIKVGKRGTRRRDLLAGIGSLALSGAARSAPLASESAVPAIGYLDAGSQNATTTSLVEQFRRGLAERGRIDGQNVRIISAWADSRLDRLLDQAADLAHNQIEMMVAADGSVAALAARSSTARLPVVFILADQSILGERSSELVAADGSAVNATGVTFDAASLVGKRLELLRALAPDATLTGFLVNSTSPQAKPQIIVAEAAARAAGGRLVILNATAPMEIDRVFASIDRQRIGTLVVADDALFLAEGARMARLAAELAVPAVYPTRQAVDAGGLLSYGVDFREAWRLGGIYAARVLAGENPADLPVRRMRRTETAINLKTAKALGIEVPGALHADTVVE